MEIRDLEFLIHQIDEAIARQEIECRKLVQDKSLTGTNPNWLKHRHMDAVGSLSGTMLFVKNQLEKEIATRKVKKFYQFWKK